MPDETELDDGGPPIELVEDELELDDELDRDDDELDDEEGDGLELEELELMTCFSG